MPDVPFDSLALFDRDRRGLTGLEDAATARGLEVVPLPAQPDDVTVLPRQGLAWRCPAGFVEQLQNAGQVLPVTAAPGEWTAALPEDVLGRRVSIRRAGELAGGCDTGLPNVVSVKLATHKRGSLPIQRPVDAQAVRAWAATLPPHYQVLLADRWLHFHSEYRVFTVGRTALTWSPYVVEGEPYTPMLRHHRASFHDEAAAFVQDVLAALPQQLVPPSIVMDVGRLEVDGRIVLLEANASWGAGLYGCDPKLVLDAVLAANSPADSYWSWTP